MVVTIDTDRYLGVTPEERHDGTDRIGSVGCIAGLDCRGKRKLQAILEREKHLRVILCSLCNE